MNGNVWDWCADWYDSSYYSNSPFFNPKGPSDGSDRVRRGGSFTFNARGCRVLNRGHSWPSFTDTNLGFRLAQ